MLNLTANKAQPTADIITADEARILGRLMANIRDVSGDDAYAKLAKRLCPTGLRAISARAAVDALESARGAVVPLKLGSTVRLKGVPAELQATGWAFTSPATGAVGIVSLYSADVDGSVSIEVRVDGDYNRLHFNAETTDLSQWLEVL